MNRPEPETRPAELPKAELPLLVGPQLTRFEEYVAAYRPTFQRADQFLRFRAYVRGLLEPSDRKNVEAIAAAAGRVMMVESNLSQALQHFVSNSPWDAGRLFAAVRHHTRGARTGAGSRWVVHDGVFAKKGRHSVGVQRQFARSVGKKINCQVGVFVAQVGPAGYFPLAARLYLPASWLRENPAAVGAQLTGGDREPATKAGIALRLLDELRGECDTPPAVTGEDGYLGATDLRDGLTARGVADPAESPASVAEALLRFEWLKSALGLDHFEGRTWSGWHHHVSLVFAAYGFLCSEGARGSAPFRSPAPSPL